MWLEAHEPDSAQVLLGTATPTVLYDSTSGGAAAFQDVLFRAAKGSFVFELKRELYATRHLVSGSVATMSAVECPMPGEDLALNGSRLFLLYYTPDSFVSRVLEMPALHPCDAGSASVFYDTAYSGQSVAADDTGVYLFVYPAPGAATKYGVRANYQIRALPKGGGPATTVVTGLGPPLGPAGGPTLVARHGVLAWVFSGTEVTTVFVADQGSSEGQAVVQEPVASPVLGDHRMAIALDEDYLYWTTVDGFVKRVRLCGGTPEVLAANQDQPIAVAVNDSAIYWLDHGTAPATGKVMRIRKLDAPDAGPDAASDAGVDAADTSVDALSDASPDAGMD